MRVVDKRGVGLSLVLLAFIAFFFWTQSRLPALDEKAQMGQRNSISALAFDVIYPLSPDQSHTERILNSAVNWAYTNWQGMSFGFLLAAAVLTLFSYLSNQWNTISTTNRYKQAAIGTVLGTPLGVCANCSTPIAFGLYRGGLPASTAIAMLSSSPSFNVIVLMMSISLLPLELVVIKSFFVLIFVLLLVPYLNGLIPSSKAHDNQRDVYCEIPQKLGWSLFLRDFVQNYGRNLLFILKGTLPLMLLAGLLAAVIAEFVSLDALSGEWSIALLVVVAICAAFFPVPIAFDVVISVALLAAGLDIVYVATIFFALGVFSVYPAMMIAKDLSYRLSLVLFLAVVLLAVLAGLVASSYDKYQLDNRSQLLEQGLSELKEGHYLPDGMSQRLLRNAARACHALGEPRQYVCFEQFVSQTLLNNFSQSSCRFLEDAVEYRSICNRAYDYQKVIGAAIDNSDVNDCNSLSDQDLDRCRYDYYFAQSSEKLSLLPCLSLKTEERRQNCLSDSLSLNLELFPNLDICSTLNISIVQSSYYKRCLSAASKVREDLSILQQGDLELCLKERSPNENNLNAAKSCQVMVISSRLERGEDKSFCGQLIDKQVRDACFDMHAFFQSTMLGEEGICKQIQQNGLRLRCIEDAIQSKLVKAADEIRFDYLNKLSNKSDLPIENHTIKNIPEQLSKTTSQLELVSEEMVTSSIGNEFSLKVFALSPNDTRARGSGDKIFSQETGQSIGLFSAPAMKATELFEPFSYGRGIAASDFNQDLWPDLAIAYADRVVIYENKGGAFGLHQTIQYGDDYSPILVSFVDLNSDGLLDLFVSLYAGENRIYWNQNGTFEGERYQSLFLEDSQLVMSAAFQDVDHDGDVDMALGGWYAGDLRHFNPHKSQNYFVENSSDKSQRNSEQTPRLFKAYPLPGVQGETLSLLFSDIDQNGKSELLVGNDMDAPDVIYQWQNGRFELAELSASLPEYSAFNTMSISSGDLNRDKQIDYFSVDMSFGASDGKGYCVQPGIVDKDACELHINLNTSLKAGQVAYCGKLDDAETRKACLEAQVIQLAKHARQESYCDVLDESKVVKTLCLTASEQIPPKQEFRYSDYPIGLQRNVLNLSTGKFWRESAVDWGVTESHWSWHSKIADLNNDGWKDIYIGNGYMFGETGRRVHSNVLFINEQGNGMREAQKDYGLEDFLNTPSFVSVDFDRDGDLDIISHRVAAEHGVFVNHSENRGLTIELNKHGRIALGVRASLAEVGGETNVLPQTEEQTAGGGFLSFDEPGMHFGMSERQVLGRLEILWPDSKKDQIRFPFEAGFHYQLDFIE